MPDDLDPHQVTELTLVAPARNDHVSFARLIGSAVAARLGFDYDTIEDLRIAVSELCTSVAESAAGGAQLTLTFRGDQDGVLVAGRAPLLRGSAPPEPLGDLTLLILDAVADDYTFDVDAEEIRFTLRLRMAHAT